MEERLLVQARQSVAGFWILTALLVAALGSSAVPSPLYPVYAAEWHLTPLVLTEVFAVYVAGLLATLLVVGRLSDHIGRKPMIIAGGLGIATSLALFAVADGPQALIGDRILQGVSVGALMGAIGAGLIDHSLERRPALAGVLNGVLPSVALATGALTSGVLVEWGPAPKQLVYAVFAALVVLLVTSLLIVPERAPRRPGALRSLIPNISVPSSSRGLFRSLVGALVATWALGGLYLSLVPSTLRAVFGIGDHFTAGALIAVVTGVGAVSGLAIQRLDARRGVLLGLAALVLGPLVTIASVLLPSLPGLVFGSAVAGIGFGATFQAALRMLLATAAPTHRAGLLSMVYVVSYVACGLPVVLAGLFVPVFGLVPVLAGYVALIVLAAGTALGMQHGARFEELKAGSVDLERTESSLPLPCAAGGNGVPPSRCS